MREIEPPVNITAHAHHEQRHLLVLVEKIPVGAVFYRLGVHRAGVHRAHRLLKDLVPLFKRPLIGAEYALILADKAVAEAVLKKRA